MEVKDNVKPLVTPVRKVLHALKPKLYFIEMWYDLFDKPTYWRNVILYDFNNYCVLETIST